MNLIDLSIGKLYENSIQTVIDIINETVYLIDNNNYYKSDYYNQYIKILTKNDRLFYIGIILIILSFVIYFIDGASI
uniref:Uncharacterized protein n=1 Tax=viral metagenome TaxID=1070528 RepID=A0A6C0CEE1_9ZZZZ